MKYYIIIQLESKKQGRKTWKSACTSAVARLREKNCACQQILCNNSADPNGDPQPHIVIMQVWSNIYGLAIRIDHRHLWNMLHAMCVNVWIILLLLCVGGTIGDAVHYSSVAFFFNSSSLLLQLAGNRCTHCTQLYKYRLLNNIFFSDSFLFPNDNLYFHNFTR